MDETIDAIRQHVHAIFGQQGSHGLDHVLRVADLCELIGKETGADPAVLLPAALLHDIARPQERETGVPHEEEGARMAEQFLRSLRYDEERIRRITHAIRTHRYRALHRPQTLEAQILSDADKLDAMGAVGIARTFLRAGEEKGGIRDGAGHIREKLLNLKDRMYTDPARVLAEKRHDYLIVFLAALESELREDPFPGAPGDRKICSTAGESR